MSDSHCIFCDLLSYLESEVSRLQEAMPQKDGEGQDEVGASDAADWKLTRRVGTLGTGQLREAAGNASGNREILAQEHAVLIV